MAYNYYAQDKRERDKAFRQLGPNEHAKFGDLIIPHNRNTLAVDCKGETMKLVVTSIPRLLMSGAVDYMELHPAYIHQTFLTTSPVCSLLDVLIKQYITDETKVLQRKYSIWRERMILPRHEWQNKPLPLP